MKTDQIDSSIPKPTVSIYQQPDHVAGLLEQLFERPLLTGETQEVSSASEEQKQHDLKLGGDAGGKVKVPIVSELHAGLAADFARGSASLASSGRKNTYEYVYSQAYYLYVVRNELQRRNWLKQLRGLSDATDLSVGDFVEFEASFSADQVAAALDILSPVLVAEITKFVQLRKWAAAIWDGDPADQAASVEKAKTMVPASMELAKAIAEAVRSDFRSDKTREYYGSVGAGGDLVTAITICDTAHFVVEDHDRILDGRFRVLGKVTDGLRQDRPILDRNKLLNKLNPKAIDQIVEQGNHAILSQVQSAEAKLSREEGPGGGSEPPLLGLGLDSRVRGMSIRLMPIAIYV